MPLDWQLDTTVVALQGRPVAITAPADKQVLTWDNATTAWTPMATQIPDTVYNYNGTVANIGALPSTGQSTGDTYLVTGSDAYYFWNGSAWVPLAPPLNTVSFPEAPTNGQVYGRDGAVPNWQPVLPLSGGTMTGPIIIPPPDPAGNPDQVVNIAYVQGQLQKNAQFLGLLDAAIGDVFYTPQSGLTSGPLVPAAQVNGSFVIAANAGTIPTGPALGVPMQVGDWLVSNGVGWVPIHITGTGGGGGGGSGTITGVTAGQGLTGGGTTGNVTIALVSPVPITLGGSGASNPAGALDNFYGTSGTQAGLAQRNSNGTWSLLPNGTFAPINSPIFTGDPQVPMPPVNDNDNSIASTAWVQQFVANYLVAQGVLTNVTASGDVTAP